MRCPLPAHRLYDATDDTDLIAERGQLHSQREADAYELTRLHQTGGRSAVWRAITEHLSRWFPSPCERVVDLGCGYGDFINQVRAAERIAVDPRDCECHLADGVSFVRDGAVGALAGMADGSVDLIMASNLLEHLDWDDVERLLAEAARVLRHGGRLMLLQPNFARDPHRYFDDHTHRTVFTHESLVGWTRSAGLRPIVVKAGYLPLTMKSRLPQSYWLTRTYLALGSPVLGGQMLVVAERP